MTRRPYLLLPILATFPFLFYAVTGYGGHDFRFHVTAWLELHQAWAAHDGFLGWSSLSQHGFGDPRFAFYPPLSLLVGAALTFLLPFRLVPGIIPWLILALAGLSMYFGAARLLPPRHRLQASVAYLFNPYLLLTLIARYAVAEAWVQAIFPLTYYFFYRASTERRPVRPALALTLLLAIGWLTNLPASIVLAYTLTLLTLVLAIHQRSVRPILPIAIAEIGALLLSAFRLLPAFTERTWIAPQALLGYSFRDEMPTLHQHHILVLVCALMMTVAAAIALLSARLARPIDPTLRTTLLVLTSIAVLFELPLSNPLWAILPELPFVQFPFRFLFLLSFASTLLLFSSDATRRLRAPAIVLSAALALLPFLAFSRLLPLNRFPNIAQAQASWSQGYEGTPEYLPKTAILPLNDTPLSPPCPHQNVLATPNTRIVEANVSQPCFLTFPTFFYPFWTATLDNTPDRTPVVPSAGGLLAVLLPSGPHRVTVHFAPSNTIGAQISLLALLAFVLITIQTTKAPAERQPEG